MLVEVPKARPPPDKIRSHEGPEDGAQADCRYQQGRIGLTHAPDQGRQRGFHLFAALDASEDQLDFPILYGSAEQGWMAISRKVRKIAAMAPLFELVVRHVAPPQVEDGPFRMLGTIFEANPYLGRVVTGRIFSGSVKPNQPAKVLDRHGTVVESRPRDQGSGLPHGLERMPIKKALPGTSSPSPACPKHSCRHLCAHPKSHRTAPGAADRSTHWR